MEDDKITFNTYPSIHRDYCGCVWGDVRMNCDSEQLRALALFAELRVWDTEDNNGVMLYLLLEQHAIELIADRALNRCVAQTAWDTITQRLAISLRAQQYENGLQSALEQISGLLVAYFPSSTTRPRDNTVSDAPVLLP